ncbi:hypothetical protein EV424DRAFT_1354100 [Suillus variegatus]|nr:hypothetical protein EV424DRAFT_1354100 [Suillus variegatus]
MSKQCTALSASNAEQVSKRVRSDGGSRAATASSKNPYISTEAEDHSDEDADETELADEEEGDSDLFARLGNNMSLHRQPTARSKNPYIDTEAEEGSDGDEYDSLRDAKEEGDSGPSMRSLNVTCLPGPAAKHTLAAAITPVLQRQHSIPWRAFKILTKISTTLGSALNLVGSRVEYAEEDGEGGTDIAGCHWIGLAFTHLKSSTPHAHFYGAELLHSTSTLMLNDKKASFIGNNLFQRVYNHDCKGGDMEEGEDMSLAQRRPRPQNRQLPKRFRDILPQPPPTVPSEVHDLLPESVGSVFVNTYLVNQHLVIQKST